MCGELRIRHVRNLSFNKSYDENIYLFFLNVNVFHPKCFA